MSIIRYFLCTNFLANLRGTAAPSCKAPNTLDKNFPKYDILIQKCMILNKIRQL